MVGSSRCFLQISPIFGALLYDVRTLSICIFGFLFKLIRKFSVIVRRSVFVGLFGWYGRCKINKFRSISFDLVDLESDGLGIFDLDTFSPASMNSAARLECLCPLSSRC